MKIKPIMCLRTVNIVRRITAWLLLLCLSVGMFGTHTVPVKADGDKMYGIWCSTCAEQVDEFVGVKKSIDDGTQYTIKCANCDNTFITIESESYYVTCDECGGDDKISETTIRCSDTVDFPEMEIRFEENCTCESFNEYFLSCAGVRINTNGDINISDSEHETYTRYAKVKNALLNNLPCSTSGTSFTWTEWYDSGKVQTSSGTVYHGLTEYLSAFGITAQRVDSYSIIYDANGGNGDMEAVSAKGGESYTLSTNTFTKTGHTFKGWATSSSGAVEYANGATLTPTADITLYAVWEADSYDITCIDMDSTHNIELGRTTVQKSYGASVKGSDFGADKTLGTYYSGYSFTVGTSATVTTDAGSNIVYRYFEPTTCSVTLVDMVLNEDTVLGTDTSGTKLAGDVARGADYGTASPYQGYTFNSDTSATVSGDGTTVYRYFTRNNYTVAYVDIVAGENGKELGRTNIDKGFDVSVSGAELGTDATVGVYYPGYYYNGNSSTSVVTIDGATVYRYFEPAAYDVTYISVVNDVAGRELGRELKAGAGLFDSVVSGDAIGTDTTEGAYFPGYSYYASTNATVTTEGAVVYRIFKPMQYSLSLELNGGTLDDPMDSYEFGAYVELPNVYRVGYSFKGWYDNAECVGEPVTAIATGESGAKTYYALWSNDNYNIKMDYAGTGSAVTVSRDGAVVEDGSVHYGDTVTVDFGIDAGRKFNGYSITETVTDAVASGNGITFTMPNSDVNIVTYWLECTELLAGTNAAFDAVYKVEPYWNGAAFNVDAQPSITITPDMVSVFARVYDTQTQTWSEVPVDSAAVSFVGSNVLSDINNTIFTVQTDVFGDGYNQQGSFSLTGASGALDNAMNNSNSGNYVELKGYIDNMESDIALYEKLVSDLQTKLNISNELKEEYSAKVAELASELVKAQADYEKAQSDNAERIAELQSQLAQNEEQYASRISELMAQIEIIDAALQQEGADIENLTGQRDELNRQLAEVIAERDSTTSALQTELNSLTTEVQTYRDKMTALQGELETTRTTYEGQIASLETELDEIRTETDALLAKIQTMEDAIKEILGRDDINLNDGSLDDLKGVLDDLKDKVDDLTGKNNALEDAIESKEDVIDDLDKIIDDLRDSIKDKTEEIEELEAQNKSDSKELEKLKEEVATNKGIIKTLESQKSSLEQEITVLRTQVDSYKEQVVSLQAQLEEKNATILSLQSEIASLKSNGGSQQVNVTGVSTVTVEKEKEIAMDELTVTPLSLITIANDEKEPLEPLVYTGEQELLSDYPEIVEDTVMSDSTLAEGDDSMTIPVQVWFGIAGAVLVAGFGIFYFLNRRYHWKVLPF
ncbi:MAG: InlB B-repeat-containing protein [Lachnospiraceae bacterium]|nr:InlB B-repeat-containing protein [Lachnospiraceae bacterium]